MPNSWVFTSSQKPLQAAAVLLSPPNPCPDDRGQADPVCPQTFLSAIRWGQSPTPLPFRKLLERGRRGKWSSFQQLVRISREYSEPLSSQASGRVMKKMRREKLAPAPPFSPFLCFCCTTPTLGSAAIVPGFTLKPDGWGWEGKERKKGIKKGIRLYPFTSLSPSRYSWNSTPTPQPTTPLLHPAIFQGMEHESECETSPDTLSPHSGVEDRRGGRMKAQGKKRQS